MVVVAFKYTGKCRDANKMFRSVDERHFKSLQNIQNKIHPKLP